MLQLNRNQGTASNFWSQSSFSYKFYLITTVIIFLSTLIFPQISTTLIDMPYLTSFEYQFWRLFFSMFCINAQLMSIISILFAFLWLHRLLKDTEICTVYTIFEVIIINFEVHLLFNLMSYFFVMYYEESMENPYFYGYFWFKIIIVYEFRLSVTNPQQERRFCFLPFTIKGKYYPYLVLLLTLALSQQLICILASALIGLFQQVYKKQMLIKLPVKFYLLIQSGIPNILKNRDDFVLSKNKFQILLSKCLGAENQQGRISEQSNYVFNVNQGVKLDNSRKLIVNEQEEQEKRNRNFRNHWAIKPQDISISAQQRNKQKKQVKKYKRQSKIRLNMLKKPQIPTQFTAKLDQLYVQYKKMQEQKRKQEQQNNRDEQNNNSNQNQNNKQIQQSNFNKKGNKQTQNQKMYNKLQDYQIQMK